MKTKGPTDADLVAKTLAGVREDFAQLYDRHARMVRAVVAGVSGDWPAVEDMTQECFLRAYRNLARLRDPELFGAWIAGIARQVGRERRRTLRRDRHEFRDLRAPEIASAERNGEAFHGEREQLDLVLERVAALPERERLAVHAYFFGQENANHIAEMIGLSRSGFYALLQRALAELARSVRSYEAKEGTKIT